MPNEFAIIDIETTGGNPKTDRITEIAIYRYDGSRVVASFESLINPEMPIPDFITRITGIDNDMVREAPRFFEVAREIVEITRDAVFVAHNVRFDYSFVQKEFRQLGYTFSRKQLCTVKLSRKVFPGLPSYSLGKLCDALHISNQSRHRAVGDATATLELFRMLTSPESSASELDLMNQEIAQAKLPPNLDKTLLENIPDEAGVYYFIGEKGKILYVGKSNQIRKRILSHFQGAYKANRSIQMLEQIFDISYEVTGSELVALLLENEEIKRLQPPFNRAQRRREFKFGIYTEETPAGYRRFFVDKYQELRKPLAGFSQRTAAEGMLERKGRKFELCPKLYDAEKGPGRCFHHQLHICKGACVEEEPAETYNERVAQAAFEISYGRDQMASFLVVGEGRDESEQSVVWVENGVFRGYAFLDLSQFSGSPASITEFIPYKEDLPDVNRIIQGYIKKNPRQVIPIKR
ncbi:MAG: exonuclease domain-containing protein [Bacteroidia bacterium]|nr:exonuclease domain-containing protein [Bacteroidia bacterium]